jgi:hypothetical protein
LALTLDADAVTDSRTLKSIRKIDILGLIVMAHVVGAWIPIQRNIAGIVKLDRRSLNRARYNFAVAHALALHLFAHPYFELALLFHAETTAAEGTRRLGALRVGRAELALGGRSAIKDVIFARARPIGAARLLLGVQAPAAAGRADGPQPRVVPLRVAIRVLGAVAINIYLEARAWEDRESEQHRRRHRGLTNPQF